MKQLKLKSIVRGCLFCMGLFFWSFAAAQTQDPVVKLSSDELVISQAFREIGDQTGNHFAFNQSGFNTSRSVKLATVEGPLSQIMSQLLQGSGYGYTVDGNHIIIIPRSSVASAASNSSIRGVVTDQISRKPLADITVEVVGTDQTYSTSASGRFRADNITAGTYALKFSSEALGITQYSIVSVAEGMAVNVNVALKKDSQPPKTEPYLVSMDELTDYNPTQLPGTYFVREQYTGNKMEYVSIPRSSVYRDYSQKLAIKTNALWWVTVSPNFAAEFAFNKKWTLDASVVYNPWRFADYQSRSFWLIQPEARYWFCQSFERHFIGLHLIYGEYCLGRVSMPLLESMRDHIYDGYGYGAGVSWGYHLPLGRRWGVEFTVGAGWIHFDYDQYKCIDCRDYEGHYKKDYFGPTKAGISLAYMIR